ncbi:MAG: M48 family metallopeptidase [Phascolarctobacterium sp.]|nr:M48 family metallopeptidase [Phascolarctobacterium sp.]
MKKRFGRLFAAVALALGLSFAYAPHADAGLISLQDEIKMGRETGEKYEQQYGLLQDSYQQARVNRIGQRLAAVCGRNDIEYTFKVLNCDEVNAFACPGGFIYVYSGLLDFMPTDTELAGVLGHEVGHVAKKHTVHQIEKALGANILLAAISLGTGSAAIGNLSSLAASALMSGFSRTDERGADKEGVNNTIKAGFNPYAMLITSSKLEDLAAKNGGGKGGLWSSHPDPEERYKRVSQQLQKLNIEPAIKVVDDNHAQVYEGNWTFDINNSIGATKAKYRAFELAGNMYTIRQRGTIAPNYFVVYDNGSSADIYYDDIQVLRLYTQDAGSFGSAGSYARACSEMLKDWANKVNNGTISNKKKKK